jgi:1-deoxyxylulose-5-phosphate synthase
MDYIRLGKTGLKVSRICLGMMTYGSKQWREWILEEDEARPFVQRALEHGVNFFDTADMYSVGVSEEILGRAIRDFAKRDEIVIATKVFQAMGDGPNQRGLSRKHIFESIDNSLRRLETDYVDLYQIHRWDYETPIEETLDALNDLVRAGKVRYLGASSMWGWQLAKAVYLQRAHGWAEFVSMQNHYNLLYREEEREMIPFCVSEGIGVIPWSPLARGLLTGGRTAEKTQTVRARTDDYAHKMYYQDADFAVMQRNEELAGRYGVKPAQMAVAWMLHKPGIVAPIIGASKLYQLDEAVGALAIKLTPEDITYLEEPYIAHEVLGHS